MAKLPRNPRAGGDRVSYVWRHGHRFAPLRHLARVLRAAMRLGRGAGPNLRSPSRATTRSPTSRCNAPLPVSRNSNTSGTSIAGSSRTRRHRDLFKADPVRYAPQFETFCAVSLARGEVHEASPEYWLIIDDKLYLFGKAIGSGALSQGLQGHARTGESQPRATAEEALSAANAPRPADPPCAGHRAEPRGHSGSGTCCRRSPSRTSDQSAGLFR